MVWMLKPLRPEWQLALVLNQYLPRGSLGLGLCLKVGVDLDLQPEKVD